MIYKFKKGSKIHIKESQKGSFTKYCNGKVTNECIQRGKNSPNPKIRKKAIFAQNARRWKHKDGGKAFINGVNVLDSNPKAYKHLKNKLKVKKAQDGSKLSNVVNFLKSDTGQGLVNAGQNIISGISQMKKANKLKNQYQQQIKEQEKYLKNNIDNDSINLKSQQELQNLMQQNPDINYGTVDLQQIQNKYRKEAFNKAAKEAEDWKNQAEQQLNTQINAINGSASNNILSGVGSLAKIGMNYLSSKNNNTTNSSPTYNKIISNNYQNLPQTNFKVNMSL